MDIHFYLPLTLNNTFCCNLSFSMGSTDEKLISLDTALHFNIFFGTLASCSLSGNELNVLIIHKSKINILYRTIY